MPEVQKNWTQMEMMQIVTTTSMLIAFLENDGCGGFDTALVEAGTANEMPDGVAPVNREPSVYEECSFLMGMWIQLPYTVGKATLSRSTAGNTANLGGVVTTTFSSGPSRP